MIRKFTKKCTCRYPVDITLPEDLLNVIMNNDLLCMSMFNQLNSYWYKKTKHVIKGIFFY